MLIKNYLLTGNLPVDLTKNFPIWAKEIEFFEIIRGILYRHEPSTKNSRRNHTNYQVVLPLKLRPIEVREMHDEPAAGHLAYLRTYLKIKNQLLAFHEKR